MRKCNKQYFTAFTTLFNLKDVFITATRQCFTTICNALQIS